MLTNDQASEIASAWHSVMTWNDPGVAMYSVTSTGKIHSESHRVNLLRYIDSHMSFAAECDERGESPMVMESNLEDLTALREWVVAFEVQDTKEYE